jgi:hypothetical protein
VLREVLTVDEKQVLEKARKYGRKITQAVGPSNGKEFPRQNWAEQAGGVRNANWHYNPHFHFELDR